MTEEAQQGDVPTSADGGARDYTDASAARTAQPETPNGANGANGAGPNGATTKGRHAAQDTRYRPRPHPRPAPGNDYSDRFQLRFRKLVDDTDTHEHPVVDAPQAAPAEVGAAPGAPPPTDTADPPRETAPRSDTPPPPWWRGFLRSAVIIGIVLLAAVVLRLFVVGHYYIPSASMEPTLHGCPGCNDDHVAVDKVSYRAHPPEPGDIVVFDRPPGDVSGEKQLIKRVIGVGGDTVTLRNGRVYVNGLILEEPYVNKRCGSRPDLPLNGVTHWTIPRGDVFVMGDNRCNSFDSRAFGPIKDSSIVGRAFAIIWPVSRARLL